MWGQGTGRYANSTIADVTLRPNGELSPLHNFNALSTLEYSPTARLTCYGNYGGDYIFRQYYGTGPKAVGYGIREAVMTGCNVEVAPSGSFAPANPAKCTNNNKDVQEASFGYWYNFYNGPKGRFRQGIQYSYFRRDLWSGAGGTTNPGGGAHGDDNVSGNLHPLLSATVSTCYAAPKGTPTRGAFRSSGHKSSPKHNKSVVNLT